MMEEIEELYLKQYRQISDDKLISIRHTNQEINNIIDMVLLERQSPKTKPSSEGFEGQASGCEKAEKPRDEGS